MKRLLRIFDLSKNEQRVVMIVLLALLAIAFVGYERRVHHSSVRPTPATEAKPSVSLEPPVGVSKAAESSETKPMSATVVVVPSEFDNFMIQTGNIQITFPDGHSEVWTTEGDCASPRVTSKGDVGWIRVDKSKVDSLAKNRIGEDKVIIQLFDGRRKEFPPHPAAPFIGNWKFADNNTAVAIQSSGYHGPSFYIKYDLYSGKVVERISNYVPLSRLPSWAKEISDEVRERPD
jgi:hypothetical protein